MEFYIQTKDGQPYEHPILGSNLREVFPDWDFSKGPPPGFAVFVRSDPREILVGGYEVLIEEYIVEKDVVRDNWYTRPMTPEEKETELKALRAQPQTEGWFLDEEAGVWVRDLSMAGAEPDAI